MPHSHKTPTFTLGVVGFGKMAEALVAGSLKMQVMSPERIVVLKRRPERDAQIKRLYKIRFANDLAALCAVSDALLLAVKPYQMAEVLAELKPHLETRLVITVAAGLDSSFYKKRLGKGLRLIRVMPNTPASLGYGAAGYFATNGVTAKDRSLCETFFGATGIVENVKREALIDAVIAVSGSGPAFIYRYAEIIAKGGTKLGLKKETAYRLAMQTLLGAAHMLSQTGLSPEELIAQVTSKKGTTLAGLAELERQGFADTVQAAMRAAVKRSIEIGKEMEKI